MSQNKSFMDQYKALEYSKNFETTEHLLENEVVDGERDPKFEQGLKLYAEWLGETFGNKIRREKWKKEFIVCKGDIPKFAKKIGDDNPLHNNRQIAVDAGFNDIIAPGAMIDVFITETVREKFPIILVCNREIKFLKPIYEVSTVQVICTTIKEKKTITKVAVEIYTTSNGLVAKGSCLLFIPQMRKRQQKKN